MPGEIKTELIRLGSDLVSHVVKLGIHRAITGPAVPKHETPIQAPAAKVESPIVRRPTTEQTIRALQRRLGGELYDLELDLADGLKIAGLPCDCFQEKHGPAIVRIAKEITPMDPNNPVYSQLTAWIEKRAAQAMPEAVMAGTYEGEYSTWQSEAHAFRKAIMGTLATSAILPEGKSPKFEGIMKTVEAKRLEQEQAHHITLDDAKKLAADEAAREVDRIWKSPETK